MILLLRFAVKISNKIDRHRNTILSSLYGRIFGYSFKGKGLIIEGDFDPKT